MNCRRNLCAIIAALAVVGASDRLVAAPIDAGRITLTLPRAIYGVAGQTTNIFFDNLILSEKPEHYHFELLPKLGSADAGHWTFTPTPQQTGEQTLSVLVKDNEGGTTADAQTQLCIAPADAGAGRSLTLLLVGDSLTHASVYPNELARLLSQPGNPKWKMLGTHHPAGAAEGVNHEGYGGWTWARFATFWNHKPPTSYKDRSSPFVFAGADGKLVLDVGRYFDEQCHGERPDVVTFLLGINDCFSANPDDPQAMDRTIDAMLKNADVLLAAFRKAAPKADLAICLTTPPNSREAAFQANYAGKYHRWGWKRTQHELVRSEIAHFAEREKKRIFIIPTELVVDPVGGYPDNNAVHPSAEGYRQIAGTIYAWLKWRMREDRP